LFNLSSANDRLFEKSYFWSVIMRKKVQGNGLVLQAVAGTYVVTLGWDITPSDWPDDRFDVVWLFDRTDTGWSLSQLPQLLLSGDSANPIS
jgi:hypothetical protein